MAAAFGVAIWAVYTAQKQKNDIYDFADKVSQNVQREGPTSKIELDGTVEI